jgi:hypothetical protein
MTIRGIPVRGRRVPLWLNNDAIIKQRNQAYRISHWKKNKPAKTRLRNTLPREGKRLHRPDLAEGIGCRAKTILQRRRNRRSGSGAEGAKEAKPADRAPVSSRPATKSRRAGREPLKTCWAEIADEIVGLNGLIWRILKLKDKGADRHAPRSDELQCSTLSGSRQSLPASP